MSGKAWKSRHSRHTVLLYLIKRAARRNRIGAGRVRDKRLVAVRPDADLADRQALAELHKERLAEKIARTRPHQEVDVEVGRHRELHPADLGEDGDIERDVGERENRRTGNRAARPKLTRMMDHAQNRPHRGDLFDRKDAADLHLRKFLGEEGRDLIAIEGERRARRGHRRRHYTAKPAASAFAGNRNKNLVAEAQPSKAGGTRSPIARTWGQNLYEKRA